MIFINNILKIRKNHFICISDNSYSNKHQNPKPMKSITLLICFVFTLSTLQASDSRGYWNPLENERVIFKGERLIQAVSYRSYFLQMDNLHIQFQQAPQLMENNVRSIFKIIDIPMPDGSFQSFSIFKVEVMHPDLAAKYPQITTYAGQGISDPLATARFDFTQFGFHAMIMSPNGNVFIDPYSMEDQDHYMVYYKRDFRTTKEFVCHTRGDNTSVEYNRILDVTPGIAKSVGDELKTYRLAVATTGEYTTFHGGTVAGGLAGVVTSINRVSGIYEREFAIRMVLIPNNDTIIFTNAATDPYTNNNGAIMLGQNQTTLTNYIGGANYDIGHVFSTGGGGIAGLGVVCNFSSKGRGVTGLNSPINDPFDVDYVAHEIGHQYGGNHTFNCEVGGCNGNRAFSAAYEPGSGSTIMAYAGLCGSNNLQNFSNDYFHSKSFDEITNYTTTGVGAICPVITQTGNTPPVINPHSNYIIPYLTPFRLTASAFDPDGDPLTYCWEQYNLGPAGTWNNPSGNAPIFRSFNPTVDSVRLFPRLANILLNNLSVGEIKPSYARVLSFKLTVRDNQLNGGGVTNNDTPFIVDVINTGQAFAVTSPNVTGIKWQSGGIETVTWDVGGSDLSPISTPLVNILLSTDGGQTFPIVLASQVLNNGSYNVNVPAILTTTARVMVEGDGNIFFDINDANFEIGTVGINESLNQSGIVIAPNPANEFIEILFMDERLFNTSELLLEMTDAAGRKIFETPVTKQRQLIDVSKLSSGLYFYRMIGGNNLILKGKLVVH